MNTSRHPSRHALRLAVATAALVPLLAGAVVVGAAHALEPGDAAPETVPVAEAPLLPPVDSAALEPAEEPVVEPAVEAVAAEPVPADIPPAPRAQTDDDAAAPAADAVSTLVGPGQSVVVNRVITGASEISISVTGPVGDKRLEIVTPEGALTSRSGSSASFTLQLRTGSPLADGSYRFLVHNRSDEPMQLAYEISWRAAEFVGAPLPAVPRSGLAVATRAFLDEVPLPEDATGTVSAFAADGTEYTGTLRRDSSDPEIWRSYLGAVTGDFVVRARFVVAGDTHEVLWTTTIESLDDVAPALEYLTEPAAANARGWFARTVTASLIASDSGAGVRHIEWQLNDGPVEITPGGISRVVVTDGQNVLRFRAVDDAGNTTPWRTQRPSVDSVAPTAAPSAPAQGAEYRLGESVAVAFSCADALSQIHTCVGTLENGVALPTDAEGDHSFEVVATDRAGNLHRETVTYRVVDPGLPVVDLVLPSAEGDDGWFLEAPELDLVGSDHTVEIHWIDTVDGVEVRGSATGSSATFTPEREGVHELRYWAIDDLGRRGETATAEFKIDATDPEITVTSPVGRTTARALAPGQVLQGASLVADFACDDAVSGLASCVGSTADGARLPTGTLGMQSFTVTATDAAGRSTQRVVTYEVVSAASVGGIPVLAVTGSDALAIGALALLLVGVGGAVLLVVHRRALRG